jgi:hypothetical protein
VRGVENRPWLVKIRFAFIDRIKAVTPAWAAKLRPSTDGQTAPVQQMRERQTQRVRMLLRLISHPSGRRCIAVHELFVHEFLGEQQ